MFARASVVWLDRVVRPLARSIGNSTLLSGEELVDQNIEQRRQWREAVHHAAGVTR
jgi:hypothetical protein